MALTIDFLEIIESDSKYDLKNLTAGSDVMLDLFHKHLQIYYTRSKFWKPRIDIGKQCMNSMRREIFTPGMRAKYRLVENKWPIELQLMKRVINTLSDKITDAIPGANIEYEDNTPPEYAAKPETVKTVISWMESQLKIPEKLKRILRTGLVTGYPICLWYEQVRGITSNPGLIPLIPSVLNWDSVFPDQYFDENDGVTEVTFVQDISKTKLYERYPGRVEEHKSHLQKLANDPLYNEKLLLTDSSHDANDRNDMVYKMIGEGKFNSEGGRNFVIQNVFPIVEKVRAWINPDTYDVFVPPFDWTDFQKESFLNTHPEFNLSDEVELRNLWVTIIDSTGFVWENNASWYQEEGELPGSFYIADMIDNTPCGAGEDRLPYILLASACATEGLDAVRRGTGRITAISEGGVRNVGKIKTELTAPEGVIVTKKNTPVRDAIAMFNRVPNTTFLEMQDRIEQQLELVDGPNDAMLGVSNPRQSNKAKTQEAKSGLSPHSPYVDNYQSFILKNENLECKFIPRVLTEEMIIPVRDEYGQKKEGVTVNGMDYDYSGEAQRIVNDIVSPRYVATAGVADESRTSREQQMEQFTGIIEAVGNQLFQLSPELMGKIIGTFPNMYAREASKFLIEIGQQQQEQQMQIAQTEANTEQQKQDQRKEIEMAKLHTPKSAFKFDPKDVQEAPEGAKAMYQIMRKMEAEAKARDQQKELQEQAAQQPEQSQQPQEAVEPVAA